MFTSEKTTVVKSVCLNFYTQYFILFVSFGDGGFWLINPAARKRKKKRRCACLWPNDCSARPQIAKAPSQLGQPRLEPGQTRSKLLCSTLCCAVPSLAKSDSSGSVSIFNIWSLCWVPKDCAKKWTEQTNKCSSHSCSLCSCMLMGDCVCVRVCVHLSAASLCVHTVHAHVLYASICEHVWACVCTCVLAARNPSAFSLHYKLVGTTGL